MRILRRHVLLAAAVALVVGPGLARAQSAQDRDRERPEVKSIDFTGVKALTEDEIRANIATEASRCKSALVKPVCAITHSRFVYERKYLDRSEFRTDVLRIRALYWKRGYRDAQVDTVVARDPKDPENIDITFRVTEGPPTLVRTVRVEHPEAILPAKKVDQIVQIDTAQPLNLARLDTTVALFRNALWEQGYADARVDTATRVDPAANTADVTITIDPKWLTRIGPIRIVGHDRVSERTIRRSLTMRTGNVFRRSDLLEDQRRLFNSNLFRRAAFLIPPTGDSVKNIELTVTEAPLTAMRASVGFTGVEYLQAEGQFTRYNFLGGARQLQVTGGIGNLGASALQGKGLLFHRHTFDSLSVDQADAFLQPTWITSVDFLQPWFISPQNSVALSAFAHRRSVPSVVIDRGYGANATFTRELAPRIPLSANYHFEVTRVQASDIYFCLNSGVCDPQTLSALRGNQRLSPFTLTAAANRANDPLSPSAGYQARLDLEHASAFTVSDFRYNRAFLDAAVYRRLGADTRVLAVHARAGWVRGSASTQAAVGVGDGTATILHPRTRFYAGGSRSVRGLGENQLGPKVLTIPADRLRGLDTSKDPDEYLYCDPSRSIATCDPNAKKPLADGDTARLSARDFTVRPLGGSTVLEGSVELRFPLMSRPFPLGAAVFVDGGIVGRGSIGGAIKGDAAVTPGFGIRYYSPVGPIRVDLGLNPSRAEELMVVTEDVVDRQRRIVALDRTRTFSPAGSRGGISGLLSRFTLHLSIGQAY